MAPKDSSTPSKILLQTWKVASQQCESYGWEESFTGVSMRLRTAATSGPLTLATNLATWQKFGDFVDEIWNLKGAGIFFISLLVEEIRLNVLDDSM
ncbi:hypothetical protein AVEN_139655-1 [Araneus ventricosus]|uniref:Uncharacterized protein n=1 Tax=Araneus ventricosus TaxID=182803 RepID=A0A4Y2FUW9_ARAVE|nr:hypothetical protein AVEN_139655-1 [Araneus ventricosus]